MIIQNSLVAAKSDLSDDLIIEKLESIPEHTMARDVFVPLLKRTGLQDVRFLGGPSEQGIDVVYYSTTEPDRRRVYTGIQFKKGGLKAGARGSKGTVKHVKNQAEEAFEKLIHGLEDNSTHRISRFICAMTRDINERAREEIARAKLGRGSQIDYWTGAELCNMIRKHWHDEFLAYFRINVREPEFLTKRADISNSVKGEREFVESGNLAIRPGASRNDNIGEVRIAEIVEAIGHKWRQTKKGDFGIIGFIEIVRGGERSNQIVGVELRSGRSYLTNIRKRDDVSRRVHIRHRRIVVASKDLAYYRGCPYPVIIAWYDPVSSNLFWGAVDENSTEVFTVPKVLDRFAKRQISRTVDQWHTNYPEYSDPNTPRLRFATIKGEAFAFYNELRRIGCETPAFGVVRFTLRGWKHITAQSKQRTRVLRSIELLGAAKLILSQEEHFHVCRITPKGHVLCKQTAKVTHPNRADAIISVITEKIGDNPHQFLSVYEEKRRVGGR